VLDVAREALHIHVVPRHGSALKQHREVVSEGWHRNDWRGGRRCLNSWWGGCIDSGRGGRWHRNRGRGDRRRLDNDRLGIGFLVGERIEWVPEILTVVACK
jgi:hypothetical protein